jgi:hypothetical protein
MNPRQQKGKMCGLQSRIALTRRSIVPAFNLEENLLQWQDVDLESYQKTGRRDKGKPKKKAKKKAKRITEQGVARRNTNTVFATRFNMKLVQQYGVAF